MQRFILGFLFLVNVYTASSQKVYFVYLQAEQEQPFFVKMNEKLYSSAASGYLILSRLHDSSYNFTIGFLQNKWPEQNFSVQVTGKDHGYLLKNFGEKGWGLFDLQTLAVQMALAGNAKIDGEVKSEKKDVSVFTDILSKAADDPSLKEKNIQQPKAEGKKSEVILLEVVKKEEPKAEIKELPATKPVEITEQPVLIKEDTKVETKEQLILKAEEEKIVPAELYKRSQVTKKSESSTTEGFGLVFIDAYEDGTRDTIRIIIPNLKMVVNDIKEEPKEEKKFLDISPDTSKKVEEKIPEEKQVMKDQPNLITITKNKCSDNATENDFLKLRKKMAAQTNDDGMVDEVRKYFKTKCFTVSQVKNISTLFLNDAGKYKLFDVAYTYVSDIENFTSLQVELKDDYYITRFKAMLHN